jgi:GNAT superfamily N-acetyltransferase
MGFSRICLFANNISFIIIQRTPSETMYAHAPAIVWIGEIIPCRVSPQILSQPNLERQKPSKRLKSIQKYLSGGIMQLQFSPFRQNELSDYLAIYDSVSSDYFIPDNRGEFLDFLTRFNDPFFIGRWAGSPAACGGFYMKTASLACLTWGIVHKRFHHQGLGSELLRYRIEAARLLGARQVEIHTSQLTEGFYAKFGFVRTCLVEDHFGPGIHEVDMLRELYA